MTVKPDHWIRRMALEQGMIEPYVDEQKRQGVISFGVSAYGYDIRVADEWKIFTNVNNAIVDPKNFDPKSFVDFTGEVCLIPPNSFALARSVEYIRMPRNVLGVVLGKSSYARCFRGDTRVALVDGTAPTLEEMARRYEEGELLWGYSIGPTGRLVVTLLDHPRYIGRDVLLQVILDNDESIYCTPDHLFLLRDGRMEAACNLRPGTSLMPLYRDTFRGYEMVYQPLSGHLYPTHRLADEWNIRNGMYQDFPNTHRHHLDHDRSNNAPWNIVRMDASEHIRHHNQHTFGEGFDPTEHGAAIREAYQRCCQDEVWYAAFRAQQRDKAVRFWSEERYQDAREQLRRRRLESWTEERRALKSEQLRRYFSDPENRRRRGELSKQAWERDDGTRRKRQQEIMRKARLRAEITEAVVREALDLTGSIRGAARLLNCDRSVFRRFPQTLQAFKGKNHKVVAIHELPGDHDVYCLTVPEAGNFALEAGVFVHNCGIITNFTPLEPGWEGHITIEISNTTPLPAKIYANEGIAQVLFFESDEEPEVSYADKAGKYQSQTGITLPRL